MEFEDEDNHFLFIIGTVILFFCISMIILIPNYLNVPKTSEVFFIYGVDNFYDPRIVKSFDWSIDLFDGVISNFENIIIYIFMLFGFLRLIDLRRFLENYKKD